MVVDRISRYIAASGTPGQDDFATLAHLAFTFQFEHVAPFRRLCEASGVTPATLPSWRQVPAVPVAAFRSLVLAAAPAVFVFRSSGTTSGEARSVHYQPYPDLYRQAIDAAFPRFCLPPGADPRLPILSLIPGRELVPDSSLSFMAAHILERWGGPESVTAFGRGVDVARARSWVAARQRERRPALVLATALALVQWLDFLERQDLRFRLPAGTVLFETGGFKGRTTEIPRETLLARVGERLGVPAPQVVREYGMTELSSQCYTRSLEGGDLDLFVAPPWVRVRVLDPETLEEAPAGTPGLLAIFDLANVGSAVHLLTEDLGVAEGEGFRLLGRAEGAQLRGCSLTVEELSR
ncbi:MAG TPA: acyl-protein synthetase [Thermoanaerobaculia bacterium]|nr:acyl-protein synthetase [Thermoanaerobaculia bacterium]